MLNVVIIKKYTNNKLYIGKGNTEPVGYVNLPQIVEIIRKGKDVKVIDKTGADITAQTLKPALEFVEMSVDKLIEVIRG